MLVNALSVVKSFYFCTKISRLIQKGYEETVIPNTQSFQKIFSTPFDDKRGGSLSENYY